MGGESLYLASLGNNGLVSTDATPIPILRRRSSSSVLCPMCLTQVFFHSSLEAVLLFFFFYFFSSLCPRVLREPRHLCFGRGSSSPGRGRTSRPGRSGSPGHVLRGPAETGGFRTYSGKHSTCLSHVASVTI